MSKGEDEYYRYEKYPDFLVMISKHHPSVKKADFQSIADALPDFKQGILEAAEFMYQSETTALSYEVTIGSELHDFHVRVRFPFVKGKGEES